MSKIRDRKITVSLASDLAQIVDKHVQEHPHETNRSKVVESALRLWETLHQFGEPNRVFEEALQLYKMEKERELYRLYYAELSDAARSEAAGWRKVAEESVVGARDKNPNKLAESV